MGDTYIPEPEPGKIGAKVEELIESGHELYATAVTGQPSGRVRRPTLFVVAIVGMVGAILGLPLAGVVGLIAILFLLITDSVVEL